jgi:hypothetical protein
MSSSPKSLAQAKQFPAKRNLTLTNANRKRQQNLARETHNEPNEIQNMRRKMTNSDNMNKLTSELDDFSKDFKRYSEELSSNDSMTERYKTYIQAKIQDIQEIIPQIESVLERNNPDEISEFLDLLNYKYKKQKLNEYTEVHTKFDPEEYFIEKGINGERTPQQQSNAVKANYYAEKNAEEKAIREQQMRFVAEDKAREEAEAEAKRVTNERFAAIDKARKEKQEADKRGMSVNSYRRSKTSSAQQYNANNLRRRKNRTRKHRR